MPTFCKSVCAAPVIPEGCAEITFVPEILIKAAKPDDDTIFSLCVLFKRALKRK